MAEKSPMEIDGGSGSDGGVNSTANKKGKSIISVSPAAGRKEGNRGVPWVEKYRPKSLADVAAHRDIIETIDRLTSEGRLPHLLLYGPPGTGKTSTILAVARKLFGDKYGQMILELNASDERGIDVVRQQILDFASSSSLAFGTKASVKLVLLDEADAMTKDAQFALRRVIEKYTKSTSFAVQMHTFRFAPLDSSNIRERLQFVISAEGLSVDKGGMDALVRLSGGDMRKALNILQSTHMASHDITEEAIYLCTGNPMPKDVEKITFWLLNESFKDTYKYISDVKTRKGLALVDIVREVFMFVFKINMPSDVREKLVNDLADIEYRLSSACNDKLQLGSLVSCFTNVRSALVKAAS